MRLIDADALIKEFDPNGERLDPILVRSRIVQQPTAYDVKKVVADLKDYEEEASLRGVRGMVTDMIDVAERGGVE